MSNTMIVMLLGAGVGSGVLLIIRAIQPRPTPLLVTLRAVREPGRGMGTGVPRAEADGWLSSPLHRRVARLATRLMASVGFGESEALKEQLRVLDKPIERHAYEKLFGATVGFLLPILMLGTMAAGGVSVSPLVGLGLSIAFGAAGFVYPDLPLGEQVKKRQQAFRHALSSWLDLVTIILAGGGGIETALAGAADAGDGWAFEEIRTALRRADLTGRTPWDLLDELGATIGVDELRELAASVALAGGQGAKIRQSLAAKADALRAQQGAEIETNAEERTEKMIVPVTVMIVGLTLFIGFGAVDAIGTDGGGTFVTPTTESAP